MSIQENKSGTFSTAKARLDPPLDAEDCAKYPTLDELVRAEMDAGHPATIRYGRGWTKRTVAEIAASCAVGPPPTWLYVSDLYCTMDAFATGTDIGDVEGELYLGNAATREACTVFMRLTVIYSWFAEGIDFRVDCDDFLPPCDAWLYLKRLPDGAWTDGYYAPLQ